MSASAFHQRQKERSCAVGRGGLEGGAGVNGACRRVVWGRRGESITANERSARAPASPLILGPFKDR